MSGTTATISWAPVNGATSYRLEIGTAAGANNIFAETVGSVSQSLSPFTPGTYFVRVRALNGCGSGPASGEASFSVVTAPPPPPPQQRLEIYGGYQWKVFLGCFSCNEYASESVFNRYGSYGSNYSSTSIWNEFSIYGSPYGSYSACNPYASAPPLIVEMPSGRIIGALTLNRFATDAITDPAVVAWLQLNVCAE